jgi:hypothetical protein
MSSKIPPSPSADLEWALQERARDEERSHAKAGDAARLDRYRLISRVLSEPLGETLPHDFAATVAVASEPPGKRHFAAPSRQLAILISIGAAYLLAMTTAALLMGMDLRHAIAAFDGSIILMAFSVALSQAVIRTVDLVRLARSPLP